MAKIEVSGAIKITGSGVTSGLTMGTRTFSAAFVASTFIIQDIVLPNGTSDFVVSIATLSAGGFLYIIGGTSTVRINPGLHIASSTTTSGVSTASVGITFNGIYGQIGSGASGPLALHFANSSGDSATVTVVMGM